MQTLHPAELLPRLKLLAGAARERNGADGISCTVLCVCVTVRRFTSFFLSEKQPFVAEIGVDVLAALLFHIPLLSIIRSQSIKSIIMANRQPREEGDRKCCCYKKKVGELSFLYFLLSSVAALSLSPYFQFDTAKRAKGREGGGRGGEGGGGEETRGGGGLRLVSVCLEEEDEGLLADLANSSQVCSMLPAIED